MSRKPAPVLRECGKTWPIEFDNAKSINQNVTQSMLHVDLYGTAHVCHLTVSNGQPHPVMCRCDCGTHHQRTGQ